MFWASESLVFLHHLANAENVAAAKQNQAIKVSESANFHLDKAVGKSANRPFLTVMGRMALETDARSGHAYGHLLWRCVRNRGDKPSLSRYFRNLKFQS
jgi:hypothetical protein